MSVATATRSDKSGILRPANHAHTVSVVSRLDELRALAGDWDRLGAAFPTPLVQHDWFLACAETLHAEHHLRVVVVRREGTVVAVAPLVLVPGQTVTWLEVLGAARLHEPADLLFDDASALDALVDGVLRLGFPIHLRRIPIESPVLRAFRKRPPLSPIVVIRETDGSCHLAFPDRWEPLLKSMGPKSRAGFRSKERKASQLGRISFEQRRPASEDELWRDLQAAFEIEALSWKGRVGSALLTNDGLRSFFERYARSARERDKLRIYFYRIGERAIATRIAVEFAGRLWFLKTGYDEACARLSPGLQITQDIIKHGIDRRLSGCEFLGSEEPWQHAWPVETHRYCTVIAYPPSLRGLLGTLDTLATVARGRVKRYAARAVRRHESGRAS